MYSRVIRLQGDSAKADEAIKNWTQQILPLIKKQKGFAGASLMGNRKTGEGVTVTYWETEQAMKDARPQIRPSAEKTLAATGGRIVEEDECEVAVQERFQPAKSNTWARVTTVEADPAKVSEGISSFKSRVVPIVQKLPGARAAIFLVNRQSGKGFAGTVWDTEKDLQNSEAAVAGIRKETVEKVGAKGAKVEVFEIFFSEVPAATPASR